MANTQCYAGDGDATWGVVTGADAEGNPLYTPTCDTHLASLLDHNAASYGIVSAYQGGTPVPAWTPPSGFVQNEAPPVTVPK